MSPLRVVATRVPDSAVGIAVVVSGPYLPPRYTPMRELFTAALLALGLGLAVALAVAYPVGTAGAVALLAWRWRRGEMARRG